MKIAAVTLVRDSEKFIIPHLKMYKGVSRNIVLFIPQVLKGGASGHLEHRDRSRELIEKYMPEVEIFETKTDVWGAELFNEAIALASDCDKVFTFHADVVMSPEVYQKFYDLVMEDEFDLYRLDMKKCMVNYYHDLDHGIRDCLDNEPIAVSTKIRYKGFYNIVGEAKIFEINDPAFEVHHLCGFKGIFATEDWFANKIPSESGVTISQLEPADGWITCPIKNQFDERSF